MQLVASLPDMGSWVSRSSPSPSSLCSDRWVQEGGCSGSHTIRTWQILWQIPKIKHPTTLMWYGRIHNFLESMKKFIRLQSHKETDIWRGPQKPLPFLQSHSSYQAPAHYRPHVEIKSWYTFHIRCRTSLWLACHLIVRQIACMYAIMACLTH